MQDMFFEMIRSGEYKRNRKQSVSKKQSEQFTFALDPGGVSSQRSFSLSGLDELDSKPTKTFIFSLFLPIEVDLQTGEIYPTEEISFEYQLYFELKENFGEDVKTLDYVVVSFFIFTT